MSDEIRVVIQLRHSPSIAAATFEAAPVSPGYPLAAIAGVDLDETYQPVPLPAQVPRGFGVGPREVGALFNLDTGPEASSYIVRAAVRDEEALNELRSAATRSEQVIGVFRDPTIAHFAICPSGPVGNDQYVEQLLQVKTLRERGMDGSGVRVAIVDTGINLDYLNKKGKTPGFDNEWSWSPTKNDPLGQMPVDHGTMCSYDACIAAPKCSLADQAVLRTRAPGWNVMDGVLSDAIRSYGRMLTLMTREEFPKPLVVNNSWGMFHQTWDFEPGDPGNYSDNPSHPFNILVASLERAGADILFAAGNCGRECPDGRCNGVTEAGIYGANSSEAVLCVGGVVITKERIGYSTQGPGRLSRAKPDIASYTHFTGSGVYGADGGTSAACPVAAGVVAAVRSVYPQSVVPPAVLRNLIRRTAEDLGSQGFDYDHGYGVLNTANLLAALERVGASSF